MIHPWQLRRALRVIRAGGVLAYPTEAVWGLGCDPFNPLAVRGLLALKGRSPDKGLIVLAAHVGQIEPWVRFPDQAIRDRVLASWPGPVTWLLPALPETPGWLTGGRDTLAVRVTTHPVAAALCRVAGPLVSTSANPAGRPPARRALQVRKWFAGDIDLLVPGETGGERAPSRIIDARSGRRLR
ncbi:MAG: tRNA threonylcarbamoyladenosine biosynthesis protein RimN [Gammaproteobacteria bacterium]|nr:MAG: tRNA threonylcarbamoyladenosine biosynthesis protein RimN [Gammaproteobacteria bacterium]